MESNNEVWVFLSHSNKDYEKVCLVRDRLEAKNFRPLMFFLKCLDDSDEIEDLIKREIDARTRFLLCESKNTRNSKWVQKEVEYIKNNGRMFDIVNLENSIDDIEKSINQFMSRSTVFISYGRKDYDFVMLLQDVLIKNDYKVFFDRDNLSIGNNFRDIIERAFSEAAQNGYVLYIISENSILSEGVTREIKYAIEHAISIIPIKIDQCKIPQELEFHLRYLNILDVADSPKDSAVNIIVDKLRAIDERKYQR